MLSRSQHVYLRPLTAPQDLTFKTVLSVIATGLRLGIASGQATRQELREPEGFDRGSLFRQRSTNAHPLLAMLNLSPLACSISLRPVVGKIGLWDFSSRARYYTASTPPSYILHRESYCVQHVSTHLHHSASLAIVCV